MTPAWTWLVVGPLFLVGFGAFFSALVPRREGSAARRQGTGVEHHHVKVVEPHPFDWEEE